MLMPAQGIGKSHSHDQGSLLFTRTPVCHILEGCGHLQRAALATAGSQIRSSKATGLEQEAMNS